MKNKLICIFILALFLASFISLSLVKAPTANDVPGMPSYVPTNPEEAIDTYKNKTLTKWEYLSREWKNISMKYKPVVAVDNFLRLNNPYFKVIFGIDYSFSIDVFATVLLTIWFFVWLVVYLKNLVMHYLADGVLAQHFKKGKLDFIYFMASFVLGVVLTITITKRFMKYVFKAFAWLITIKEGTGWRIVGVIVALLLFALINMLLTNFNGMINEIIEKREKKRLKGLIPTVKKMEEQSGTDEDVEAGKAFLKGFGKAIEDN